MRVVTSLALGVCMFLTAPAWAADPVEQHNSNALWFENWVGLSNATLTVVAPNGKAEKIFAAHGTPVFELSGYDVADGVYSYELSAATDETREVVNQIDNGRGDAVRNTEAVPFVLSGRFVVSRGVIITPEETTEDQG